MPSKLIIAINTRWVNGTFLMRTVGQRLTHIAVVACVLLAACKTGTVPLHSTEWRLVRLSTDDVSGLKNPVTLLFSNNENRISGFGGCNRYFGSYQKSANQITFSNVGATKMYCPETQAVEDAFFRLLNETDSFNLSKNNLLLLKDGRTLLEFTSSR